MRGGFELLYKAELVIDARATLGEGPCWDAENRLLYWVDILEKKIHIYNPITRENRDMFIGQMVGAIVPRKSGGLVAALENGFYYVNPCIKTIDFIYNPESHLQENRFNDGKCDPVGRFWAGTTDSVGVDGKGALYCLHTDLSVSKQLEKVSTSNGLAWSPNGKYMYFIDTPTRKVVCFQYDMYTGHIKNPKDIIEIPEDEGLPDGMTIDEEGMLWIAHWGGGKITRWNPMSGEQLHTVRIPALYVTSCTFGGENLNELYVTTARTRMTETDLEVYPYAGGVFKIKTNVRGCVIHPFNN